VFLARPESTCLPDAPLTTYGASPKGLGTPSLSRPHRAFGTLRYWHAVSASTCESADASIDPLANAAAPLVRLARTVLAPCIPEVRTTRCETGSRWGWRYLFGSSSATRAAATTRSRLTRRSDRRQRRGRGQPLGGAAAWVDRPGTRASTLWRGTAARSCRQRGVRRVHCRPGGGRGHLRRSLRQQGSGGHRAAHSSTLMQIGSTPSK